MPAIPVLITIRSSAHRDQDAEDETISMLTSGQLELEDTRAVIRYEETLDESLPAQQVVMTIDEGGSDHETQRRIRHGHGVSNGLPL